MTAGNKPQDALESLVGVFETKGWLNQTLRIRRRDRMISDFLQQEEISCLSDKR
jgi:hypothetical protein